MDAVMDIEYSYGPFNIQGFESSRQVYFVLIFVRFLYAVHRNEVMYVS